ALRIIAWAEVDFGDRWFEWDRVEDERQLEAVRRYTHDLLAEPAEFEVVLRTLAGHTFTNRIRTAQGVLPKQGYVSEVPLPALIPIKEEVKPRERLKVIERARGVLTRAARPDGSYECYEDDTTDVEAAAYAVLAFKTVGWPVPHEAATRDWLLDRQRPD